MVMASATISGTLVDLLSAALEDPELSAEQRTRLRKEIEKVLWTAHEDEHGHAGHEPRAHDDQVDRFIRAVLVNPDLHTDMRMRMVQQIEKVRESA